MSKQNDYSGEPTFSAANTNTPAVLPNPSPWTKTARLFYATHRIRSFWHQTTIADIEDMIMRTGLGDRVAFSALYDATSAKLFGVCLRILNNRTEAEDALQDVFVKIWKNAGVYKVNGYNPMTWLITVARNLAISRLRARKALTKAIEKSHLLADSRQTSERSAVQTSERAQIDVCLGKLDQAHVTAMQGVYLVGETYQDLADRAGVPVKTMRTWLRLSLVNLKD